MAKAVGHARSTIHRIWRALWLCSRIVRRPSDPLFVEKVRDIVGLYLSSPDRAVVLCVEEKRQVQALDRTQPLLPMRAGQAERRTHDYTRHGTTSLFAALDVQAGIVIGISMRRHRTLEFRKFLDEVERNVPADLDIHVVMDNYGTHKTKLIRDWFAKRQRWHVHSRRLQRPGSISSSASAPSNAAPSYPSASSKRPSTPIIDAANADPKPFQWTKSADDILASIERFCLRTLATTA
jgi:transposase